MNSASPRRGSPPGTHAWTACPMPGSACTIPCWASTIAAAAQRLASLTALLAQPAKLPPAAALDWQPEWSEAGYRARVERVRTYIGAGDIFQANLTHRFRARRPAQFSATGLY